MTISHFDKFHRINSKNFYGGKTPEQTSLDHWRKTFLCGNLYRRWGNIFNYNGPNPVGGEDQTPWGTFYIVYPSTTIAGNSGTLGLGLSVQCWNNQYLSNPIIPTWDGITRNSHTTSQSSETSVYNGPNGPGWYDFDNVLAAQNTFGPFSWTEYYVPAEVASLSVYTAPEPTADIRGYGLSSGKNVVYNLKDDTFNINQPLRGVDADADTNGSIGTMAHYMDNGGSSLHHNTRQCVFSWGHQDGNYCIGSSGTFEWKNIFNNFTVNGTNYDFEAPILPRALIADDATLDLAMVGEWNTGTKIRVTTSKGTYTKSFTSDQLTTAGTYDLDNIKANKFGDELLIEAYVNDVSAINIRSISFWESATLY